MNLTCKRQITAIAIFFCAWLFSACHFATAQDGQPNEVGVYTLINVDGIKLPATVSHGDVEIEVQSGTFAFNADGTCESTVLFGPPSRDPITRKVTANYTRDGNEVKMNWRGAGKTVGSFEGDRFSMNNEGMMFNYEKQASSPPEDMQSVLDRFLGTWESVHRQVPDGQPVTVTLTYAPVLGGKFVQETGEVDGKNTALAMFTYDTKHRCYRMWHFSAEHPTSDATGKWDLKTKTLTWTTVDTVNLEMTMTSRHRFIAENRFEWEVVGKDANGKDLFHTEGKASRISEPDKQDEK